MKYRDILGFSKKQKPKKKVIKEKYKSKKTVLDKVKQELNEWNDTAFRNKPKRWSNSYKNKEGLTEFERLGGKDLKEAGAGYDYHKVSKSIEKSYKEYWEQVKNLEKLLEKTGQKKEAKAIHKQYAKYVLGFQVWLRGQIDRLL